jgi:tRNA A58 N-methylase Trm61
LHIEILERFRVLRFAPLEEGMNVLETGCGAHAITTVPLAYLVGETSRVVAVDKARWRFFEEITSAAGAEAQDTLHKTRRKRTALSIQNV